MEPTLPKVLGLKGRQTRPLLCAGYRPLLFVGRQGNSLFREKWIDHVPLLSSAFVWLNPEPNQALRHSTRAHAIPPQGGVSVCVLGGQRLVQAGRPRAAGNFLANRSPNAAEFHPAPLALCSTLATGFLATHARSSLAWFLATPGGR